MEQDRLGVKNIRLTIEYDGSDFCGWQRQRGVRTVEGDLIEALLPLIGVEPDIIAAARTDSGVHALGQVANFTSPSPLAAEEVAAALNALLPPDVRIIDASEAPLTFNARYDARQRSYEYLVSSRHTALWRKYRWHVRWALDVGAISDAGRLILGRHDFSAFTVKDEERSPWITVADASAAEVEPGVIAIRVSADRFLRRMVRMLVGTLVEIGRGKVNPSEVCDILSSRERQRAGPCAPPHGLYLVGVGY
jgi:tRNA pseudouridine38-40 synthase